MTNARKTDLLGIVKAMGDVKRVTRLIYRDRTVVIEKGLSVFSGPHVSVLGFEGTLAVSIGLSGRLQAARDLDTLIDGMNGEDRWDKGFSDGWEAATREYKVGDHSPASTTGSEQP